MAIVSDFNVMPTELDVYTPERWFDDALFRREVRTAYADLVNQGWTDALRFLHPDERIYISGIPSPAMRGCASIISCSARPCANG